MLVPPKKNQYALRAIFELAKHMDQGPIKISDIAAAQSIPLRFLEVILNQLKASGHCRFAKRGFYGGYFLVKPPTRYPSGMCCVFSTGAVPTDCIACVSKTSCPFDGQCAFSSLWITGEAGGLQHI
jgi:Rrf2 family cysteine metabolism transcriptional repressor